MIMQRRPLLLPFAVVIGFVALSLSSLPSSIVIHAFMVVPTKRATTTAFHSTRTTSPRFHRRRFFMSSSGNDDDDDNTGDEAAPQQQQKGMEEAFRELDALDSIDLLGIDAGKGQLEIEYKKDEFVKARQEIIDSKTDLSSAPQAPPEEEMKMYTEMYQELETNEQEGLYSDVLADMGITSPPSTPKQSTTTPASSLQEEEEEDAAGVTSPLPPSETDMEQFMNAALQEALKEAREKTPEEIASLSENILDDKEMMDEIRVIFEKGNKELLESLEDIRKEQAELAKTSAKENSRTSEWDASSTENAERMAQAQDSMAKLLKTVDDEKAAVEQAVLDLKAAQEAIEDDSLVKLMSGNLVKQAALVGTLLFTVRAGVETFAMIGGGGGTATDGSTHATAALIQGAIALACAGYFFLSK